MQLRDLLGPQGALIASVPNFGHWYVRARTALGTFDYDRRGVLDRDHLRFFTRSSFARLLHGCGLEIVKQEATGLPLEALAARGRRSGADQSAGGRGWPRSRRSTGSRSRSGRRCSAISWSMNAARTRARGDPRSLTLPGDV